MAELQYGAWVGSPLIRRMASALGRVVSGPGITHSATGFPARNELRLMKMVSLTWPSFQEKSIRRSGIPAVPAGPPSLIRSVSRTPVAGSVVNSTQ